jgi:hypothetical protein
MRMISYLMAFVVFTNAVPACAVSGPVNAAGEQAGFQSERPLPPHHTDDRRTGDQARGVNRSHSSKWTRIAKPNRHFWMMILLLIPSLISSRSRARAEDDWVVFQPATQAAAESFVPVRPVSESSSPRRQPCPPALPGCWLSGGHITMTPIAEYPRIESLDYEDGLFDTWRANLIGRDVPEEWDFQNLINTDRPDFTDATFTVGQGVALLETGYTYRRSHSGGLSLDRRQLPESLLRIGMTDEFELRIKWVGYVMTDIDDGRSRLSQSVAGTDDLQLGFKYEISQQDGWRPMFTFVGTVIVPSGTNGVSVNQVQPSANLVYGWGIRRWLYLKGSTGVDFAKTSDVTQVVEGSLQEGPLVMRVEDNVSQWHQSLSLLFQVSPRIGGFAEWFSFYSDSGVDNRASHYLDTGLYIYITPNVQLDVRVGERISNRIDTLFTGAGFSTRW